MGIRPNTGENVETHYRVDGSTEAQQLINDAEHTGNEASKVFAEVAAQAESANKGTSDLSRRIAALESSPGPDLSAYVTAKYLESLPLLLHWDGKGTKPQLKPGWGLLNTTTGVVEKG
ncbi:hypothetical protein [Corynebacterium aurimucosum]|uniref:hypothetical protein n=1 Tax=Corynebacterium aurimucosum TaxID=169292 RepID=UPI003990567E